MLQLSVNENDLCSPNDEYFKGFEADEGITTISNDILHNKFYPCRNSSTLAIREIKKSCKSAPPLFVYIPLTLL